VAALTGTRLSELLALRWDNLRLADPDDAEIEFVLQVDRRGVLRPTKTDGSVRTVPIPRELALILCSHWQRSTHTRPDDFVFATRTGRPFGQRNIGRALRRAQLNAKDENGQPTFAVLHEVDERGEPVSLSLGPTDAKLYLPTARRTNSSRRGGSERQPSVDAKLKTNSAAQVRRCWYGRSEPHRGTEGAAR
jgi:integrase